ncbi:hypothetical protein EON80_08600 [bacterium]|nr:MAG: hypothetical protein EON80_08600 [bacterium]
MATIENLRDFIEQNQLEKVRALLNAHPEVVTAENPSDEELWLHFATWSADAAMVRLLVEAGANINARSELGYTPLHAAVESENRETLQELLALGANPNIPDQYGITPLLQAARAADQSFAAPLLDAGAKIDLNTMLALGDVEGVCELLERNPSAVQAAPAPSSLCDDALLMIAYKILRKAEQIDDKDEQDRMIAQYQHMLMSLFQAGVDINAPNPAGQPPLYTAMKLPFLSLTRFLLEQGADVNFQAHDGFKMVDAMALSGGGPDGQAMRAMLKEFGFQRTLKT